MDVYVQKINREASNAYCEELFKEQAVLLRQKQELEDERDIFGAAMIELNKALDAKQKEIEKHFEQKDQVLEETEKKYRNRIPYREIYRVENVYPGLLDLLWKIYDNKIYYQLIVNTHVNAEAEIIAKKELLSKEFPPMKFVPIKFHIDPYRDEYGKPNNNRPTSDKIGRLLDMAKYIDPKRSIFVDNTKKIIIRGEELGLNCYFVKKNLDPFILQNPVLNPIPYQVILQSAHDTIEREHPGKILKLSR